MVFYEVDKGSEQGPTLGNHRIYLGYVHLQPYLVYHVC